MAGCYAKPWPDAVRNRGRMPCETMAGCCAKPWPDAVRNHGRMLCGYALKSIRNLDLMLTVAIGHIGILSEKADESIEVRKIIAASKRLYGLAKFTFYAIADGLTEIFSKLHTGIGRFFFKLPLSPQLVLTGLR